MHGTYYQPYCTSRIKRAKCGQVDIPSKKYCYIFRQSNNAANQLRKYQKENDLQNYTLIQQVDHRWNSDLDMIESQITIRTGLNQIMADLQKKVYLLQLNI